jgi:thymidine phosphorylase
MNHSKYNTVSLIRKKRDGYELEDEEVKYLVDSYTSDVIPDYQMSAFLMASYLQGLSDREAAALTRSMLHSGEILDCQIYLEKKWINTLPEESGINYHSFLLRSLLPPEYLYR